MPSRISPRNKRLKRRQNIYGFLILGIAIVSAAFVYTSRSSSDHAAEIITGNPVVGQFDTVALPVPIEPVIAGTPLKQVKFQMVDFPEHQIPKGALRDVRAHFASIAITPLPANLPVFAKNISANASASNPVIERIPEGMRAMTIRVDATSAVEGWASSGAIVDVLLVTGEGTNVVAEKVRILSAERSVNPIQNITNPTVPSTVTLLVTQEQCLAINTAIPLGKIAFALRSIDDVGRWSEKRFHKDRLSGRAVPAADKQITGYIRLEGDEPRSFALSGNNWIPTDVEPHRLVGEVRP